MELRTRLDANVNKIFYDPKHVDYDGIYVLNDIGHGVY